MKAYSTRTSCFSRKIATSYDASENPASAYGYYLDEFMWDETADLFALNARRDFASISIENGRESIRQSLKSRYPSKKPADFVLVHQLIQPVIHVARDGQSAKMRVRLFQLAGPLGGNGSWVAGVYECRTGVEDKVWKFKEMDLDYIWTADYKGGWAHINDKAKGVVAAPFPKIVDPPFHYRNPLTGRKPPVLLLQRPTTWAQPITLEGVPNLHKVSETLHRSDQPAAVGIKNLEQLGIKTVVNLRGQRSPSEFYNIKVLVRAKLKKIGSQSQLFGFAAVPDTPCHRKEARELAERVKAAGPIPTKQDEEAVK